MKPPGFVPGLQTRTAADYEGLSRLAVDIIVRALEQRPELLLCTSAGTTPTRTYQLLAQMALTRPKLFRSLRVLQIDEWGGLPPDSPASCEADLRLNLLDPLEIDEDRFAGFSSRAKDPEAECARIAQWLAGHGPIDLCILGLGVNGHIAMNEPAERYAPYPHVAKLAPSSRRHPMLRSLRRKPRYGLTLGLGDILQSRQILLLVNGPSKRAPLKRLLTPRVTTRFPASFLWLHPQATILCDRACLPERTASLNRLTLEHCNSL